MAILEVHLVSSCSMPTSGALLDQMTSFLLSRICLGLLHRVDGWINRLIKVQIAGLLLPLLHIAMDTTGLCSVVAEI